MTPAADDANPCARCGTCCKSYGGDGNAGLPLYPWEFRDYQKKAAMLGLRFEHTRQIDCADRKNGIDIVGGYRILSSPCIFFDQAKGCTIYDERPLVCRSYPYQMEKTSNGYEMNLRNFHRCPSLARFRERMAQIREGGLSDPQISAAKMFPEISSLLSECLAQMDKAGLIAIGPPMGIGDSIDIDILLGSGRPLITSTKELLERKDLKMSLQRK